jgi:hypothetical protein
MKEKTVNYITSLTALGDTNVGAELNNTILHISSGTDVPEYTVG